MRRAAFLAAVLLLGACASQPPEAQLATACNGIAAGYRTAAAYVAQGKMAPATVVKLASFEGEAETICDPAHPPADINTALAAAQNYLNQITLANAGVK